jgi:2,3-bisphosphoglycerate-independent phosphoglycerate mutase
MKTLTSIRPLVLVIRDGWGENPDPSQNDGNAVYLANTPVNDRLIREYPHALLHTGGRYVGLPDGVMGNSEVGHQNIGAGRIVEQEVMRITSRIGDGSFFKNEALIGAFDRARATGGAVHLMGLCSDGRVHADLDHVFGLIDLSRQLGFPGDRVYIHAFTDGRDTAPDAGIGYIEQIERKCAEAAVNPVASVIGRYYAMDRDHRWDRIEMAYRMLTRGEGERFPSAAAALKHYYDNPSESSRHGDEFVTPSVVLIHGRPATIRDGDSVIFFNFRGDRTRELTKAFTYVEFPYSEGDSVRGFGRGPKPDVHFVTMTAYEEGLPVRVAFPKPPKMKDVLGAYLSRLGLRQFRCAESEKYAHVTFFFNDYHDEPFEGESRLLVPSPRDVTTYDHKPEMSAYEVTEAVLKRLDEGIDDVMVINYANGDMVGHTGILEAAIRAVEVVDECVGRVVDAVLRHGGGLIVTADHGNAEQMIDPKTGGPHTAHTAFDVDCIIVDSRFVGATLREDGCLADLAPTALHMMGIDQPEAMTGRSLLG